MTSGTVAISAGVSFGAAEAEAEAPALPYRMLITDKIARKLFDEKATYSSEPFILIRSPRWRLIYNKKLATSQYTLPS